MAYLIAFWVSLHTYVRTPASTKKGKICASSRARKGKRSTSSNHAYEALDRVVEAVCQLIATTHSSTFGLASTPIPTPSIEGQWMKALAEAYGEDFTSEIAYKVEDIFLQPGRANMFLAF
ncbi:hypothetical protein AMTR_s00033p00186310 [Amborella trichopoda]|uniref:Uncharacterized protein n=1 Tax=Amborella trichopoda TaxID=13333 RepID=U5CME0_AMBTC|nr:hypothetical protein AMTR_s00033p00186310 [Amborella trichopoda]